MANPNWKKELQENCPGGVWLLKKPNYTRLPDLAYKAGDYYLTLPFISAPSESKEPQENKGQKKEQKEQKKELNWTLMGKVHAVYDYKIYTRGDDSVELVYKKAFLYSAQDRGAIKYRLQIPETGEMYDVVKNGEYTGAKDQYNYSGKILLSAAPLNRRFTHRANYYFFNVDDVKNN